MPSIVDTDKKSSLISRINRLNDSLIHKHQKVVEITKDDSFPTNNLVRKALEANQESLETLVMLQETIDSFDSINQSETMESRARIEVQNDLAFNDKKLEEDCLLHYKKTKSSFLFSLVVMSSVILSAFIFFNFLSVDLENYLLPIATSIALVLVGFTANFIGMKRDKRILDLSVQRYQLQIEIISELTYELQLLEKEKKHLDCVKSGLSDSLKHYNLLQRSIMDCYEGQFNE
ncbi:hypothetical protein [Vibrio splendidus]|uniref:Uncharacterized protein n=1 Tax=Vibrio splendidus TaxID=29497 RepID=A0A837NXA3_VIBSP|nr:hypothetical protein [Vibrio splendidus]KPL94632.1 hypothetical protein AN168_08955 [Vibrio splendidus]